MPDRRVEEIARDVFECATAWTPNACLVGNVTAAEMARLARAVIDDRATTPSGPGADRCFGCREFDACAVHEYGGSECMCCEAMAREGGR